MKVKLSGLMKPWRVAKKLPGQAAEHGADGEGGELGDGGVDAERAAGDLVLAQRFPGAADRQPPQFQRHEIGDQGEAEDHVIEEDDALDRVVFEAEERC